MPLYYILKFKKKKQKIFKQYKNKYNLKENNFQLAGRISQFVHSKRRYIQYTHTLDYCTIQPYYDLYLFL
jgi:hypothetical protein